MLPSSLPSQGILSPLHDLQLSSFPSQVKHSQVQSLNF